MRDITEGKVKKGGQNEEPTTPRPMTPVGQKSSRYDECVCGHERRMHLSDPGMTHCMDHHSNCPCGYFEFDIHAEQPTPARSIKVDSEGLAACQARGQQRSAPTRIDGILARTKASGRDRSVRPAKPTSPPDVPAPPPPPGIRTLNVLCVEKLPPVGTIANSKGEVLTFEELQDKPVGASTTVIWLDDLPPGTKITIELPKEED